MKPIKRAYITLLGLSDVNSFCIHSFQFAAPSQITRFSEHANGFIPAGEMTMGREAEAEKEGKRDQNSLLL